MAIRQPVVSVLGHVDHGKTRLLDRIRGTAVGSREAGAITQHIGATEVPIGRIYEMCGPIAGGKRFAVPGLLFIDTPGHQAFTSLRARGGSLADLAVLLIDIREGLMPQTIESIRILRQYRTPFVIALNKVDTVEGWSSEEGRPFVTSEGRQQDHTREVFEQHMYAVISQLSDNGVFADRYDRIDDFTKAVALVPISAKTGEGVPDLMLVLIGLAQRFLESQLEKGEGPGRGTILEVKEVKGLGQTLDMILYSGSIETGSTVAIGTRSGEPLVTRVKAILKPKPLDEIRDPRDRFDSVKELHAAAGVKIACQDTAGAIAGAPIRVIKGRKDPAIREITEETAIRIETEEKGVTIKADAIGSLEALAYEARAAGIPIRKYGIGEITRRDVLESSYGDASYHIILGFNVRPSKDAEQEIATHNIRVFTNEIVYALIEAYVEWRDEARKRTETDKRALYAFPAKVLVLPDHVFRVSKPAVVGVRVLAGRIRVGESLINSEGRGCGDIKSVRDDDGNALKEGVRGDEVSVAIDGVTVGRQINENDVLYVDMIESGFKALSGVDLDEDEKAALGDTVAIKRRSEPFWGM